MSKRGTREATPRPGRCPLRNARPGTRTAKMKKTTVLIVDDDRSVCKPLANALRREGYEALLAHDGEEAFRLYRQCRPDLVLLALNMKRQSGWEILEKICPIDPLTRPLIVISPLRECGRRARGGEFRERRASHDRRSRRGPQRCRTGRL